MQEYNIVLTDILNDIHHKLILLYYLPILSSYVPIIPSLSGDQHFYFNRRMQIMCQFRATIFPSASITYEFVYFCFSYDHSEFKSARNSCFMHKAHLSSVFIPELLTPRSPRYCTQQTHFCFFCSTFSRQYRKFRTLIDIEQTFVVRVLRKTCKIFF